MFADEVKYIFLKHAYKKTLFNTFLLGFILDHIVCPKKDNLSCPVFVSRRGMSNGICDTAVYLKSEGLNFS